jgi:predicted nucleic acid-binding protein
LSRFVADASLSLALYLPDDWSPVREPILRRITAGRAAAPTLWTPEVSHAPATAVRRRRLSTEDDALLARLFRRLPIQLVEISQPEGLGEVLRSAWRHALTSYDASYLYRALEHGLPLAAADQPLARAAAAEGVPLLD